MQQIQMGDEAKFQSILLMLMLLGTKLSFPNCERKHFIDLRKIWFELEGVFSVEFLHPRTP
jgi:hypothetical protein